MHSKAKKADFLYYRSQNWSLIRISEKIGVCRTTLVEWNREFHYTLRVLRSIEEDSLLDQILVARQEDLDRLIKRQKAVEKELDTRNLKDIPTDKLFRLASLIREAVNAARVEVKDLATDEPHISDGVPFWRRFATNPNPDNSAVPCSPKSPAAETETGATAPKSDPEPAHE